MSKHIRASYPRTSVITKIEVFLLDSDIQALADPAVEPFVRVRLRLLHTFKSTQIETLDFVVRGNSLENLDKPIRLETDRPLEILNRYEIPKAIKAGIRKLFN